MKLTKLLGLSVWLILKEGGQFWFKITGAGEDHISGIDSEGMELTINKEDIYKIEFNQKDFNKIYNLDRSKGDK